jgi:outer membrane protein TolC
MMGLGHYSVADPDFLYVAPSKTARAAFSKESRMKFASAAKSTGNPGERRALQFGLAALCFSVVLQTAPCAEAQQLSAALWTSAPLSDAVPDAPRPLLSLAQTAAQTAGPANPQDGKLYLSLQQAFTMALQNNLDLEVEQIDQSIAEGSVPLAQGGGLPRPINFTIMEAPSGVGGAAVPLLSFSSPGLAPASVDPIPSTISSSYNTSRVLETSHSLSLGTSPYSGGSLVPGFDAQFLGRYGWLRRNPQVSLLTGNPSSETSADTVTTDNTLGDTILTKGFSPGTTVELGVNNFVQTFYSGRSSAVPFSHPNAYALIAQPLFRNAGRANNTRFIAIAKTNKKISSAVLEQQMISTIAGVDSLYTDLISLQDEVKVQQQALTAAEQLLGNDQQQLDTGRLPPIEVARAESLVTSTRVLLEQAKALRDQQDVILRTLIDPRSLTGPSAQPPEIVATDPLSPPRAEVEMPLPELVKRALDTRPDVRQARLQIVNGERQVAGSANAAKPEIDLYGTYETRGAVLPGLLDTGGSTLTGNTLVDQVPTGGTRSSTVYEAGIQFYLPVQNRVAKENLITDKAILRQQQLRETQLESSVAAEVRNAITALRAAENAAAGAMKARELQERLLSAAQESFQAGYGTNLAVIEQETYLAQAQASEVVAKAAWSKAAVQLDRVTGQILDRTGISLKDGQGNERNSPIP